MTPSPLVNQITFDLFRLYARIELSHITEVKVRKLHNLVISIDEYWKIGLFLLPRDETFYTAIRRHKCSPAMREKMAMFYAYAMATTDEERNRIKADYLKLGKEQRPLHTPYWDSYVKLQEQKVILIETQLALQQPQEQTSKAKKRKKLLQQKKEAEVLLERIIKELNELEDRKE